MTNEQPQPQIQMPIPDLSVMRNPNQQEMHEGVPVIALRVDAMRLAVQHADGDQAVDVFDLADDMLAWLRGLPR